MRSTVIKFGTEEANKLGLTKDLFQAGIAFDARPEMFYITMCCPIKDLEQLAFNSLLDTCSKIHTPVTIEASNELLRAMAIERGWHEHHDMAGTITVTNADNRGREDLLKLLWQQQDQ